jgi:hypothetical protein
LHTPKTRVARRTSTRERDRDILQTPTYCS